jgi:hypothetical protein
MKESFVFYRSFYEALVNMDKDSQADCLMSLADYALNGNEPNGSPAVKMFFTLVKPQIDANIRRFENGCKGGRPKKPNNNLKETKIKPNENLTETKPEPNDNVNVNDNVNLNNNLNNNIKNKLKNFGELQKVKLTSDEYEKLLSKYGDMLHPAIEKLDGWLATTSKKLKNNVSHYAYFKSDSWVWENLKVLPKDDVEVYHQPDTKMYDLMERTKQQMMERAVKKYGGSPF